MELRVEEFQFELSFAGRPAGTQRLSAQFERGLYVLRLEAQFQGALGAQKRVQISKLEPRSRLPALFTENDNGRVFETSFDRQAGLVKLRQNRDEASSALTQDYQDPLSLLHFLRELPEETRSVRVPMIGGTVLVTRLEDQTVESPWGATLARVYYLRPGVSLVYIEVAEPHRVLKLSQSLGKYALEARLTRALEGQVTAAREERRSERSFEVRSRRPNQLEPRAETETPRAEEGRSKRRRNRRKSDTSARNAPLPPGATPTSSAAAAESSAPESAEAKRAKRRRRSRRRGGNAKPSED